MKHRYDCIDTLCAAGFLYEDATALRRISMTLHRWHELECGSDNGWASHTIARGYKTKDGFVYDDAGKPFLETHPHRGDTTTRYSRTHDRERGALKRLDKIMARYPAFQYYVQGDPRGCALYILHPNAIVGADAFSTDAAKYQEWLSANYTRGMAVCR